MKYKIHEDKEWVRPIRKAYKTMCCDCGLIHIVDFKLLKQGKKNTILFRSKRDNRATGQARRWRRTRQEGGVNEANPHR